MANIEIMVWDFATKKWNIASLSKASIVILQNNICVSHPNHAVVHYCWAQYTADM